MEIIKRTRTIEEIDGYKAFDGKWFKDEEECKKYEESAYGVLAKELNALAVNKKKPRFSECDIFERFGYGSEEFEYTIIDIKTEEDLRVVNQYYELVSNGKANYIGKEYVGKRVMIGLGFEYDRYVHPCPRTMEDLMSDFEKDIKKFFKPEEEE